MCTFLLLHNQSRKVAAVSSIFLYSFNIYCCFSGWATHTHEQSQTLMPASVIQFWHWCKSWMNVRKNCSFFFFFLSRRFRTCLWGVHHSVLTVNKRTMPQQWIDPLIMYLHPTWASFILQNDQFWLPFQKVALRVTPSIRFHEHRHQFRPSHTSVVS